MNSTFESVLECSFAASARVNLRFNNDLDITQFAGDLLRFIECRRDLASRRCYVESLQQLPGLVFMNVHCDVGRALRPEARTGQPVFLHGEGKNQGCAFSGAAVSRLDLGGGASFAPADFVSARDFSASCCSWPR